MKVLILLFTFYISNLEARVDIGTGNFSDSWIDGQLGPDFSGYQIRRVYNSKSTWNGVFGKGWCASFEVSLSFDKSAKINTCDNREIIFTPDRSSGYFSNLDFGRVVKSPKGFTWANGDQKLFFTENGRLESVESRGSTTRFFYNSKDKVEKILEESSGSSATFSYNSDKTHVERIVGLRQNIEYKYQGDLLSSLKNAWGSEYTYEYDDSFNLTQTNYPDKSFEQMSYNKKSGTILSFTSRNGCEEKYKYEKETQVQLTCKDSANSSVVKEPDFQVLDNSDNFIRSYWKNGQLNNLQYNRAQRKPSSATIGNFENKRQFSYRYDKSGNIAEAAGGGYIARFLSDKLGRSKEMALIKGSTRQKIVMSYVGASNKIQSIGIQGKPLVNLSYHKDGTLKRTESKLNNEEQNQVWRYYGIALDLLQPLLEAR